MPEIMIGLVGGKMEETKELITTDDIRSKVYIIRGQQVMLDKDLAEIYGYDVKRLNEQVKRNIFLRRLMVWRLFCSQKMEKVGRDFLQNL